MQAVEDFRSWLGLVAKDLCDAHAADRMLTNMSVRDDRTSGSSALKRYLLLDGIDRTAPKDRSM